MITPNKIVNTLLYFGFFYEFMLADEGSKIEKFNFE